MRILLTGADTPIGGNLSNRLRQRGHEVVWTGTAPDPAFRQEARPADLRDAAQVAEIVQGMDAIVHAATYQPRAFWPGLDYAEVDDADLLDYAARGTYVLLQEALKAGARRVVMLSRLDLFAGHPEGVVINEQWRPLPDTTADALATYTAELTLREFCRVEDLVGVCLRFDDWERDPAGEAVEASFDAMAAAIDRALTMDLAGRKYRWWLYHISASDRFPTTAAEQPPLSFTRATPGGTDAAGD